MRNLIILCMFSIFMISCRNESYQQESDSGVKKASVQIKTDEKGNTVEQKNIMERLKRDNEVGSLKHLYVISSYTGDVMEYSTVLGKVTSGGKRLSPKNVIGYNQSLYSNNTVQLNGSTYVTDEVLDDGGAYGESGQYLYWFDVQGIYHQYYPSGGTYLHISDRPLRVKKANWTFEAEVIKK